MVTLFGPPSEQLFEVGTITPQFYRLRNGGLQCPCYTWDGIEEGPPIHLITFLSLNTHTHLPSSERLVGC